MRGVGSVGVRSFRRAFGRWVLTAVGIVLGVAVLFAVQVANTSASRTVERRFGRVEHAQVSLTSPDRRIPEDSVATAAALDDVHVVSTYSTFDVRVPDHELDGEPRRTYLWSSRHRRGPDFDEASVNGVRFGVDGENPRDGALEVALGDGIADELGVEIGDVVTVDAPTGTFDLQVVQLVFRHDGEPTDDGLGTSEATARRLGGDEITQTGTIQLARDIDPEEWIERNRSAFAGGVLLATSGFDAESFREFVRAMNDGLAIGALTAVFIGAFLIFLTMTLQVAERTATYGMLRALGATRRQVATVVVAEAAALGAVATAVGLAVGAGLAVGLTQLVARLYQIDAPAIVYPASAIVLAAGVGVTVTVLGARSRRGGRRTWRRRPRCGPRHRARVGRSGSRSLGRSSPSWRQPLGWCDRRRSETRRCW